MCLGFLLHSSDITAEEVTSLQWTRASVRISAHKRELLLAHVYVVQVRRVDRHVRRTSVPGNYRRKTEREYEEREPSRRTSTWEKGLERIPQTRPLRRYPPFVSVRRDDRLVFVGVKLGIGSEAGRRLADVWVERRLVPSRRISRTPWRSIFPGNRRILL